MICRLHRLRRSFMLTHGGPGHGVTGSNSGTCRTHSGSRRRADRWAGRNHGRNTGNNRRSDRRRGLVRVNLTGVIVRIADVPGVDVLFVVVGFRFVGPRLAENVAAQGVREERLNIGCIGGNHEVQQVRRGRVVGDEVRGGLGDPKVQDLDVARALTGGHLAGALGHLLGVVRACDQNADRTVENLVHPVQHQILVV